MSALLRRLGRQDYWPGKKSISKQILHDPLIAIFLLMNRPSKSITKQSSHSRATILLEYVDRCKFASSNIILLTHRYWQHSVELSYQHVVSLYGLSWSLLVEVRLVRAWKVAPALAVGCTVVMKPSELTPLTALVCSSIQPSCSPVLTL